MLMPSSNRVTLLFTYHTSMSVSFQLLIKATINDAMNVDADWKQRPSFSAMPDWIKLPFEVACTVNQPVRSNPSTRRQTCMNPCR